MTSSSTDLLATGQRVIRREAGALQVLAEGLDGNFSKAVGLLMAAKGRVIVSGMGKSGHIARKIAATFASTGTPRISSTRLRPATATLAWWRRAMC